MSPTTTVRCDFDLQNLRVRGALVAARGGNVEIHDIGRVERRVFNSEVWEPVEHMPADQREWLREECRQKALPHAAEIEADIRDQNRRARHAPDCALRCDMGSIDYCTCDEPAEARERCDRRAQGRAI